MKTSSALRFEPLLPMSWYQATHISHSAGIKTASNMVFAGIGVFSVLMLFVDLRLALFLLLVVSMIDVHLMGWMWAFDIAMDATAYVECVMAVGLTVDYVIHITHSIAEAQPQAFAERVISQMKPSEIAELASEINENVENIGARRLHTIMEKLLEDISYNASDMNPQKININTDYVEKNLGELIKSQDLSKFIL